ncbi:MAG: hypothetical protein M0037_11895 [Betaproteobacteria bacterium]|nr:hypothetical protein [Betaproteobacteria bacterium]
MHKRNRLFLSFALGYGLLGGALAITWLLDPTLIPGDVPRAHGHIMLLGFLLMMIYGIALHVLPRFSGFPLYSERMADGQFYLANIGLPVMVAGWLTWNHVLVLVGGALSYGAMVLFGLNMVLTVRARGPKA